MPSPTQALPDFKGILQVKDQAKNKLGHKLIDDI